MTTLHGSVTAAGERATVSKFKINV